MRVIGAVAVTIFLSFSFAAAATAQTDTCSPGAFTRLPLGLPPRAAFVAVEKTSFEQKLYDGNVIRQAVRVREARDSAGRTRSELRSGCTLGEDGQMHATVRVTINDRAAHTITSWSEGAEIMQKVIQVIHQPQMARAEPFRASTQQAQQQPEMIATLRRAAEAQKAERDSMTTQEDLGTKEINGMAAKGTRTTETIPAGRQGNDQPLLIITETWMAVGIPGVDLMRISDDPRSGRTLSEFEELKFGEPDPALFVPPSNYKVEDIGPRGAMGDASLQVATP